MTDFNLMHSNLLNVFLLPLSDKSQDLYQKFVDVLDQKLIFEKNPRVAVALSGGIDSLALAYFMQKWVQARGGSLVALHVNHNLRPESTIEAVQVGEWMENWRIEYKILNWFPGSLISGIQEKARQARYDLLRQECQSLKILHLFTGHHQDDQHETIRMRRSHLNGDQDKSLSNNESENWGLAGMTFCKEFDFVRLIRPFLGFSKNELISILPEHPFINDPSNANPKFSRARLRMKDCLTPLKASKPFRAFQESQVSAALAQHVQIFPEGYALMNQKILRGLNERLLIYVLGHLCRTIGGNPYMPRLAQLNELLNKMNNLKPFKNSTYGNCLVKKIVQKHSTQYLFLPENRHTIPHKFKTTQSFLWNKLFLVDQITQNTLQSGVILDKLGLHGWQQVKNQYKGTLSPLICSGFPAFLINNQVIAVPFMDLFHKDVFIPRLQFKPQNALLSQFFM